MQSSAKTPDAYIEELPPERKVAMKRLREVLKKNIPKGFEEVMQYGMMGYVVPHSIYPAGYHCKPSDPLPFLGIASQKNHIAFYHMGIYAKSELLDWFTKEYSKRAPKKLNMGKSCVRWTKAEDIPYDLIGELTGKMTVQEWIDIYEKNIKK